MNSAIKNFQFETQQYQEDCVKSIITLFDQIEQNGSFQQAINEHYQLKQYAFPIQENSKNIDIMMETGTGKTFTYIHTIFELNKKFNYKKFIILIPTVPIREGTKANLEDTKDYFKALYANEQDKEIEPFVYESGNVSAINQFINSSSLSALVITPSSFNSRDNILNRPLEKEIHTPDLFTNQQYVPKTYLECLKRLNPIVIMDEPHRFEGNAFKTYFEGFDNYYLRFGATFPDAKKKADSLSLSNVAYVLDSISSFRQSLVKKIVVYTQDVIQAQDTLMSIEGTTASNRKAILHTLSNGVLVKREVGVGGLFNEIAIKKINKDSIVLTNDSIEKIDYALSDASLRAMIKDTIKIHFDKEQSLFEKGIKALSLFFMEGDISLFRGDTPKIKTMFEAEYLKQRQDILSKLKPNSDYYQYLQKDLDHDNNLLVHKGYFSGDKGNTDAKIKAGVDEILKDKKKLLSFDSPTRFIFSIWALQEGWDNPNVFTICKLSNQGSDISKLQQIGRGLRICVNQDLERQTLNALKNDQEEFWRINNLDVVVSSKEQGFVEAIQQEILSNSFLIATTFTDQELKVLLKDKGQFNDATVRTLFRTLENSEMIIFKATVNGLDVYEKSPDFSKLLSAQNLPPEQTQVLADLFATDTHAYIQNGNTKQVKKKVVIKQSHLKAFQGLWQSIYKNAFYVLDTINAQAEKQLIDNITQEIENLNIEQILLKTKRSELKVHQVGEQNSIQETLIDSVSYQSQVNYLSLVRSLSAKTKTPLSFIVKVFNALNHDFKYKMLCNNPEQAQREMTEIISKHLIQTLKAQIRYDGIDGKALPNVFKADNNQTYLDTGSVGKFQKDMDEDFSLKTKWIFEEVIEYDSQFELDIIEKDPDIDSIKIFGKLPRLKIKTPLGEYNPDFCYAIESTNGHQVFLVVEAKGYASSTAIPEQEKAKIDFAKHYFEALNQYYEQQGKHDIKIIFKERINHTELAALIQPSI